MPVTGKAAKSIKKKDLINQKTPAIGFKKITFAHKSAAGEVGINLTNLSFPSELSGVIVQPTVSTLLAADLLFFKDSLCITSSARGKLMQGLSYVVANNSQINFTDDFGGTLEDEIFVCTIDPVARTGTLVADTEIIISTGTLAAGDTDINIGKSFPTNYAPTTQIGAVTVWVDGLGQMRNVGNATASPSADGNYEEVDNGAGHSTLIRMNQADATNDRSYVIISTVLSVIRPNGSVLDEVERQAGVLDKVVETTALLAGVPESDFQVMPSQPQLKQFGDIVLGILSVEVPVATEWTPFTPIWTNLTAATVNDGWMRRNGDSLEIIVHAQASSSAGAAANVTMTLPNSLNMDTTKLPNNPDSYLNSGIFIDAGVTTKGLMVAGAGGSTTDIVFPKKGELWDALDEAEVSTGDEIEFRATIPIQGWVATQTIKEMIGL